MVYSLKIKTNLNMFKHCCLKFIVIKYTVTKYLILQTKNIRKLQSTNSTKIASIISYV